MRKLLPLLLLLATTLNVAAEKMNNGVILVYHHVSTESPPSTSISPEKFREHMAYLSEHHVVLPLEEMVETLRDGDTLPDKAVAITFDDGYEDILTNGHEILKEYKFPYTIFINPPLIGTRKDQLDWQQVSLMQKEGVSFANHTSFHDYLLKRKEGESHDEWLARIEKDVTDAQSILEEKTGTNTKYLAYPYGEFNRDLTERFTQLGYTGFGQHSGAIASYSDFSALPRFAAAGIYANLNSLRTKLNSLAMPVTNTRIAEPHVIGNKLTPEQVLTLDTKDFRLLQVNCFLNGKALKVQKEGQSLRLSLNSPLVKGRSRINCTAPSISFKGRFYWYSQPWFVR